MLAYLIMVNLPSIIFELSNGASGDLRLNTKLYSDAVSYVLVCKGGVAHW